MRHQQKLFLAMLLAGAMFAGPAPAQEHEEHHPQASPAQPAPAPGMAGMSMTSCPHMQAGALADQLLTSFAALEKEPDTAALKVKLAAHGELLKQLKQTTSQKCPMMEHMEGMGGGMMGGMMGGMQHPTPAK